MGKPIGPKKIHRYSNEFKVQAVRLSLHPEIPTQDVATALEIHPFMLSRWKKDWREGRFKASGEVPRLDLPRLPARREQLSTLDNRVRGLERKVEAQTRVRSLERKVRIHRALLQWHWSALEPGLPRPGRIRANQMFAVQCPQNRVKITSISGHRPLEPALCQRLGVMRGEAVGQAYEG